MAPNDKTTETTNNNDAATTPDWLNEEFFREILIKNYGKNYKIEKFIVNAALSIGENYASQMLRIEIQLQLENGKTDNISYILKALPSSEIGADMIIKMNLFPKEIEMYETIIPAFENLYKIHTNNNNEEDGGNDDAPKLSSSIIFSPKCYKVSNQPEAIIMEDLKLRNFQNVKRQFGLDMQHCKCALKKLAQIHAASAVYFEQNGPYSEVFITGLCTESMHEIFEEMNKNISSIYRDCMLKWPNGRQYIDIIKNIQNTYIERFIEESKIDDDEFNVLNHGDLWCNNIMFQYHTDNITIKETYFVDFQMGKYGSPAQDLYYLLISSANPDIKLQHFDYFIKYYHDHLIENLILLKYPKKLPTLKDLHITLFKKSFWGFATGLGVLTAVVLDPNDDAKLESFKENTDQGINFKIAAFTNPRYINIMEELLPWLENRGSL